MFQDAGISFALCEGVSEPLAAHFGICVNFKLWLATCEGNLWVMRNRVI